MADQQAGRARGRARGRGRGSEESQEQQPVRRPGEPSDVGYQASQPPMPEYSSGGRAASAPSYQPSQSVQTGGRASAPTIEMPPQGSGGRAVRGGVGGPPPPASRPPPGAGPSAGASSDVARVSMGRGASRGRETREPVIYTRPSREFSKSGTTGNPINVSANYFELIKRPDFHLLQYRVDFTPELDHMGARKGLVRVHQEALGRYLFDGTLLYNTRRLPQPMEVVSQRTDGTTVRINFRLVGEIQKEDATYTTVMNIIVRRCMSLLNLVMIRRDFYDAQAAQDIPQHHLTIWPGYLTTIRHHEDGFLLGVEVIHKVLRRDSALDVMGRVREQNPGTFQQSIRAELEGKVVMTLYNKKTYRVDDIDFEKNPASTFHLRKEDREITYAEYYRTRYNQQIRNMSQPLLVSRPSRRDLNRGDDKPIYLIPELASMTGLSDDQKRNFNLMKDVGNITRVQPDKRVDSLMRFRQRLATNQQIQDELNSWGLQFANQIVQCKGRVLDPGRINQGQGSTSAVDGDWSRSMQRCRMMIPVQMTTWIVFHPANMTQEIRPFVQQIRQVGDQQGFPVPEPRFVPMNNDRTNNYVDAIRGECDKSEFNMVMCVLRSQRQDTYSSVKKLTIAEFGIPSQVVTGRILKGAPGKLMSIATKVMVQLAAKMGAEPWQVQLPKTTWMVVGYDTYHDAKQRKAVGAFVASINQHFTRYFSSVKIHENNEEISPSFKDHLISSLKAFYRNNGKTFPTKIIIYRDGVGAGDIGRLKDTEIAALKDACAEVSRQLKIEYNPGLAFIVVSKRINTRFFSNQGGRPNNPPCGTVVDNTVTLNERFDFFLVSQKVTQGTVSPTSYNVIEDTGSIGPDIHQRLAYALTHLYYNWPGTLRVPAPIQYAHKLAYLVGESILQHPHEALSTLPYYL